MNTLFTEPTFGQTLQIVQTPLRHAC